MTILKRFANWYYNMFRTRGFVGKVVIGFGSLIVMLCLCSFPAAIFSPSSPTPTDVAKLQGTVLPSSPDAPTRTLPPTETDKPSSTPISTPTVGLENFFGCIPESTLRQTGVVVNIIDGDTIDIRMADGNTFRVRYIGIDTPEKGSSLHDEAAKMNSDLVNQKNVILVMDVSDDDSFGRLLRYVIVDGIFVNQELLKSGLAIAESYPPDTACDEIFNTTQIEAQEAGIGIWFPTETPEPSSNSVEIMNVNKKDEYVDIKNTGNKDIDLAGWVLVSVKGDQRCYLGGILKIGETLRIWSMTAQGDGYSCGYDSPIWNNTESDPAVLYNPQGIEISKK